MDHRQVKLGRLAPIPGVQMPMLADYRNCALPPPPPSVDRYSNVPFQMFCNQTYGCCTIAAIANGIVQRTTIAQGVAVIMPDAVVLQSYAKVTNPPFNPSTGANDNGAVETDVLGWFASEGVALRDQSIEVGLPAALDGSPGQIREAVHLFGSAYIGLALPISAQNAQIWDAPVGPLTGDNAAGSWGGHAVIIVGYDASHVYLATWGAVQVATWAFLAAYTDESYAVYAPGEWLAPSGLSPDSFDFAALSADHVSMLAGRA